MINKFKQWLLGEEQQTKEAVISVEQAICVLMIEVMMSDLDTDERERERVFELLHKQYNVEKDDIQTLYFNALETKQNSHDVYQFTKRIRDQFDEQQRYDMIVALWHIAYSDGVIDPHEDFIIRKINDLLHLHHSHFVKAKLQAKPAEE
ncbi:MAG: TerB family tellurite resistance protein [Saccharospirillaceae bacterium]|nr:TerB family tellurite resistance protein [Pseudomonadales bacterium]NRB79366.1 TerB family tellurite resistance protein [Saccharospirillaceae bacterium]